MAKKPTGSRPMPKVQGPAAIRTPTMNKVKAPIKHTPMGTPKKDATSKTKGGRSY